MRWLLLSLSLMNVRDSRVLSSLSSDVDIGYNPFLLVFFSIVDSGAFVDESHVPLSVHIRDVVVVECVYYITGSPRMHIKVPTVMTELPNTTS